LGGDFSSRHFADFRQAIARAAQTVRQAFRAFECSGRGNVIKSISTAAIRYHVRDGCRGDEARDALLRGFTSIRDMGGALRP
jgi:hypothetical protein